jgi:HAD superfamily phosphatase
MTRVLVFDIDGVLLDVTESYREAIQQTVESFTGVRPARALIQDFKNQGGWNDDWLLSHRLVHELGGSARLEEVIARFDRLLMGENGDGLIAGERWLAAPGLLERLATRFRLAIFTGRHRHEIAPSLARYSGGISFDPIVSNEMVANPKPAPDGLLLIAGMLPEARLWYIGDTVDDARSALAAGVPFIGIAAPANPRHDELAAALRREGAIAVLDDINQLEGALPA